MDYKLVKYCGYLPALFFTILLLFIAFIGGFDYLSKIPTLLYIEVICLFIAPYFISQHHYHVGYLIVVVSVLIFMYQGLFIDTNHMFGYMIIGGGLLLYFIGYDYILRKLKNI